MRALILPSDIILDDASFIRLFSDSLEERGDLGGRPFLDRLNLDRGRALEVLKNDPALGARLLSLGKPNSTIFWTGEFSSSVDGSGQTLGMRILRKRDGDEVVGDNIVGRFLYDVKRDYKDYLENNVIVEEPVRRNQVISDFTPGGALRSSVQMREDAGERFIHVDPYIPARFRFDAAMDGTTGHASRKSDDEVPFKKFVCPFGTGYPSPIVVGSAAEASMLFEKALRDELDWKSLFRDLSNRGLLDAKFTPRYQEVMINDLKSQFSWMREQISSDHSLARMQIVAPSLVVPDSSMGRSVYDPEFAPSPAHILARYINNPSLLYSSSDNGVSRSLAEPDKREPERFRLSAENHPGADQPQSLTVIVAGTDTLGGREPGTRGMSRVVSEMVEDENGQIVEARSKKFTFTFKSREEADADYLAFSERMDSILSEVPDGTRVTLVTGGASSLGSSVGVGTPRLVERYVRERGGDVLGYNFYKQEAVLSANSQKVNPSEEPRLSLASVSMEHFSECLPVLVGEDRSASFLYNEGDQDSEVVFSDAGLKADACICFTDSADTAPSHNRNVMSVASFAASAGLPVVHVMDLQSEEAQRESLHSGAVLSRSRNEREIEITNPLFVGELRKDWNVNSGAQLSYIDPATQYAVPFVSERFPGAVTVGRQSFHSALGAFVGLMAIEAGREDLVREIASADCRTGSLLGYYRFLGENADITPEMEERCMRQSVRWMSRMNEGFAERLLGFAGDELVMVSSTDDQRLFVDLDGKGENRFALVLKAERDELREFREAQRREAEQESQQIAEENMRRQKMDTNTHAEGQKVEGGLPVSIDASKDAIWFLGTSCPGQLVLPDDRQSFYVWDDAGGEQPLCRAVAEDKKIRTDGSNKEDNRMVFLFPSDLAAVQGRRRVYNMPDSRDLTGVMREDPETGKKFICAFGVPVKVNNKSYEFFNPDNMPCSYRLDDKSSLFQDSLIWTDTAARLAAMQHDMSLCMLARENKRGELYFPMSKVFDDMVYDRKSQKFVDNPHKAPMNKEIVDRYTNLLLGGNKLPLNCISMPEEDYGYSHTLLEDKDAAERRFRSDLLFTLRLADSVAKGSGKPLRFPLGPDGHIDFGPGVPKEFVSIGESIVDSYIGVVKDEALWKGTLPTITPISIVEASKYRSSLVRCPGSELRVGSNDLARAFGPYDFFFITGGNSIGHFGADGGSVPVSPLHEMSFRMDDGSVFRLVDSKLTRGMDSDTLREFLDYEHGSEKRRFIVQSTNPDRVPEFLAAVNEYIERAKGIKVEMRLLAETEKEVREKEYGLEGYVDLLSSNSEEFAEGPRQIGRAGSIMNKNFHSRFDGTDNESVYYGKVDAKDGFKGYAQFRYLLPDGTQSGWIKLDDQRSIYKGQTLAQDIVMSLTNRKYQSDEYKVPSDTAIRLCLQAEAVRHADEAFRSMKIEGAVAKAAESKVVSLEGTTHDYEQAKPLPEESLPIPVELPGAEPARPVKEDILFTESTGGYQKRTYENANADDVDFTLALAVDFGTYGELATAKAAGDSLIQCDIPLLPKNGGIDLSRKAVGEIVSKVMDYLPEECLHGEPCGINIAGNGIYTLAAYGIDQDQVNRLCTLVMSGLQDKGVVIERTRSGGQTGVDMAGNVASAVLGIPTTVNAPKGWLYRDESGRDIRGERSFKERFADADMKAYRALVAERSPRAGKRQKAGVEQKF